MNNLRRNVMTVVPFDPREALFLLIIAYAAGSAANQRERRISVCTCRMHSGIHATRALHARSRMQPTIPCRFTRRGTGGYPHHNHVRAHRGAA